MSSTPFSVRNFTLQGILSLSAAAAFLFLANQSGALALLNEGDTDAGASKLMVSLFWAYVGAALLQFVTGRRVALVLGVLLSSTAVTFHYLVVYPWGRAEELALFTGVAWGGGFVLLLWLMVFDNALGWERRHV